jgi:2-keto-4-pentenoate hydratase
MTEFEPNAAAAALAEARRSKRRVLPLPGRAAPRNEWEGAAAQRALAVLFGADRPAGFKIGATTKRMQEYLGIDGPAAGFMLEAAVLPSGAELQYASLRSPGVECELAVRLGRDLPPGPCSRDQAFAAVGELAAAIEVVENRYEDLQALGTPTLIADQVYHAAAVVGAAADGDWRALDLAGLAGQIRVGGEIRGEGRGGDLLGDPLRCLAWLAASPVAAAFGGLFAGQVVLLGSVTPPIWLDGPAEVAVRFTHLPEVRLRIRA